MSLLARPTIAFAAVRMPAQYMPSGPSAIRALIREAIWRLLTTQLRTYPSAPPASASSPKAGDHVDVTGPRASMMRHSATVPPS